jgi:malonyl-CoA O-methyltransferase
MNIVKEFSRFANSYETLSSIQRDVAQELVSLLKEKRYSKILDIGSGSGSIYKELLKRDISFDRFSAFDFSRNMLDLHPLSSKVEKLCLDFNSSSSFKTLSKYDLVISSSALQWSLNLDFTLKEISNLSNLFYFAIFTSNTFKTLHKIAGIKSPIYSKEAILNILNRYYTFNSYIREYRLHFNSVFDMLRYIKKTGVSGGKKQLSIKDIKRVVDRYPLNYLEFEVIFIEAKLKRLV